MSNDPLLFTKKTSMLRLVFFVITPSLVFIMYETLPLEKELAPIFLEKLPSFPPELKEGIAKYGPYLLIIGLIFSGLALLAAFGLGGIVSVAGIGAAAYGAVWSYWVAMIVLGITFILQLMAVSPLMKRQRQGWKLLYYSLLITLVGDIISFSFIALIIGGFLGFWVLFQIREKYS